MNNNPLVSVLITTFNHEGFISDCIDSVLSQDLDDFEIIIGDDASTDGTCKILKSYCRKYPDKIKLIKHEKNIGVTKNCNSILQLCRGKYICIIGGDDQMFPSKLSRQVDYLENNQGCNMCFHNMEAFDLSTNELLYYTHYDGRGNRKRDFGTVIDAIREGVFFSPVSVMHRSSNVPENGFDERIPIASDWLYFVDVLSNGGSVDYIDCVLGRYRRSAGSLTINRPDNFALEVDLLNSINIIMIKYPQFITEALYRYGQMLFKMRKYGNYFDYLVASLKVSLHFKGVLAFALYFISGGRFKK